MTITRRRTWFAVAGLSALAFALTLVATRHGQGVSPDSVSYLSAARSAARGHGFLDFDGGQFSAWPPGLPAVLAFLDGFGVRGVTAARYLNAAMMAGVVVLGYLLLRRHVQSVAVVLFGVALIACSPAILRTADSVLAEPLYTVLVLAFVLLLEDACRSGRYLVLAVGGVVASAAVLVKYLGFALVAAGIIALVMAFAGFLPEPEAGSGVERESGTATWRAAAKVAWFAFWGLVGPAVWGAHTLNVGLPLFGRRRQAGPSLPTIARNELEGVGHFFLPDGVPRALSVLVGVAAAAVVIAAVVVVARDRGARRAVPLVLVTAGSFGVAFVSSMGTSVDVNARVLSPAYVPFVVLTLWLFDYVRARREDRSAKLVLDSFVVLALVGLLGFVVWSAALAWSHGRHGRGYAAPGFERSELIGAITKLPSDARIYSNEPLAVAYVTGRLPIGLALAPGQANTIGRPSSNEEELGRLACDHLVSLAWFGVQPATGAALGDVEQVRDGELITVACRD